MHLRTNALRVIVQLPGEPEIDGRALPFVERERWRDFAQGVLDREWRDFDFEVSFAPGEQFAVVVVRGRHDVANFSEERFCDAVQSEVVDAWDDFVRTGRRRG